VKFGLEAEGREHIFVPHAYVEQRVDLGEIRMNYATTGDQGAPALLLIPGQSESWWGYESVMPLLAEHFEVFAVDLRGQGRSTWTPGRYTVDNMGNDLVRFIDLVIGRPVIVSGLSSGGVLSAWLSAFAKPGQVVAALYEDPPLFASERDPVIGHSASQGAGPIFALWNKWLGDQWSIGDWAGMRSAASSELPAHLVGREWPVDPPQNLREYDPEWGRATSTGTLMAGCDHASMLSAVNVPVLLTHHFFRVVESTGHVQGALSDLQAKAVGELVTAAGQQFEYRRFPEMGHFMHAQDPALFARTLIDWTSSLTGSAQG
jgi:pimeloyl-ACP methyl ester carboxylesterase